MRYLVPLAALLIGAAAQASAPVATTLTGCVLDGVWITDDGFAITLAGARHVDLARYTDKRIRIDGELSVGDRFAPTADVQVVGVCSAADKLRALPALMQAYRAQADRDTAPAAVAPSTSPQRAALDCADRTCYEVVRVPKAGGAPVVIHRGALVGHLFVDAKYVYWSEGTTSGWQMMRQAKTRGAKPAPIARGVLRGAMARGDTGFVGLLDHGLTALGDDGSSRVLVPGAADDVAFDRGNIVFSEYGPENTGSIEVLPSGGGPARMLAVGQPVPTAVFAANDQVYWANINVPPSGGGQILSVPIGGGLLRTVVETQPKMTPWALTADARSIYWVEWGKTGYELYRAPKDGGPRTLLGVAPAQVMNRDNRDHVETDAKYVYWNARESVARIPKGGGSVEEVVHLARGDVQTFAVDDTDVYVAVVID